MADPAPQDPTPRTNRAAAGVAFIGSGTALVAVGLAAIHSVPLAAGGFAIMGVGLAFVIANRNTTP